MYICLDGIVMVSRGTLEVDEADSWDMESSENGKAIHLMRS